MKFLAWDTSTKTGALAALEWDEKSSEPKLISEMTLNVDATHSEQLLWGIHQTLESARWKLQEIDVFGVGVGPGSFTGLRIGVTTARTLAHTFNKPLVGVSSLAALARPVAIHFSSSNFDQPTLVIAATDACKGELFAYWGEAQGLMGQKTVFEEQVIEPELLTEVLGKELIENPKLNWVAVGEGRKRYLEEWEKLPQERAKSVRFPFPDTVQGRYVGLLVVEAYQSGLAQDALKVYPRYLRASDAEMKLKAGLLNC